MDSAPQPGRHHVRHNHYPMTTEQTSFTPLPPLPTKLPRLSENQKRCLYFIFQRFVDTCEYPNQPEIALHGFGKARRQYAYRLVEALLKKQCLTRTAERTRNLELTDTGLRCLMRDGIDVGALLSAMRAREEGRARRG